MVFERKKKWMAAAVAAVCVAAQAQPLPETAEQPPVAAPAQAQAEPPARAPKAADPAAIVRIIGQPRSEVQSAPSTQPPPSASRAQAGSPPVSAAADRRLPALKGDEPTLKPFVLHTRVGINEVVRLSASFLNRISTPFQDPVLVDISNASYKIVGSEVFFLPKEGDPVGIYIFDKRNPSQTISLTVVPVAGIPGQNVLVKVEDFRALSQRALIDGAATTSPAQAAPTPSDHESQLSQIIVGAIQGNIAGFNPVPLEAGVAQLDDVEITPDLVYQGYYLDVYRYRLLNKGQRSLALNEGVFYRDGVKAVSFFPLDTLAPQQSTFVFIVARKHLDASPASFLSDEGKEIRMQAK